MYFTAMKKYCGLLSLLLFCSVTLSAQKDSVEATIRHFFDGLAGRDANKLKAYTAADFILLGEGEVLSLDTLLTKLEAIKKTDLVRANNLSFIKTEQVDNVAWVSYYNTANFSSGDVKVTGRWLESAVLTRLHDRWIIKLIHSSKIKSKGL